MTTPRDNITLGSGVTVILGIWLIVASFIFAVSATDLGNNFIVGIIVALLAAIRIIKPTIKTRVLSWTNVAFGVWLIISPFLLAYVVPAETVNAIIVGILVILFGVWSANAPKPA